MSDLIPIIEEKLKIKCDEAFLEDSAIRLLKGKTGPYNVVIVDLDDPTIEITRFAKAAYTTVQGKGKRLRICGATAKENEKLRAKCFSSAVTLLSKPLKFEDLRDILTE